MHDQHWYTPQMDLRTELIFVPKISTEVISPEDAAMYLVLARKSYLEDPHCMIKQDNESTRC